MHAIEAREQTTALGAAVLMHGLLAAGLLLSLSWSQTPPPVVQVELWASPPSDRPNTPIAPPAVKTPAPKPAAEPEAPQPQTKADISAQKKPDPPKRQLEEAAKREAAKKEAAEKARQKKLAQQREEQRQQANRKAELERLLSNQSNAKPNDAGKDIATKAGASEGAEVGAKTGVDADYTSQIRARIRARITYPDRAPGNPEAVVRVDQLPSGEVIQVQLSKSSGITAWDDAVQRAIWAASPLPKKKDGTVERTLLLTFRPKETP